MNYYNFTASCGCPATIPEYGLGSVIILHRVDCPEIVVTNGETSLIDRVPTGMTAHTWISFIKSGMRGIGYALLAWNIWAAVIVLILEECVI